MRRLIPLFVFAAIVFAAAALWWTYSRDRMDDAVALMQSHAAQLAEIRAIIAANPNLCAVAPDGSMRECTQTLSKRDRAGGRRIAALLRDAGVQSMDMYGDDVGAGAVVLGIYDNHFDTGGIVAWWGKRTPGECHPAGPPGWRACRLKGFVALF